MLTSCCHGSASFIYFFVTYGLVILGRYFTAVIIGEFGHRDSYCSPAVEVVVR
jgi:hypothetical protein